MGTRAVVAENAWTKAIEQGFEPLRPHQRHQGCTLPGIADPIEVITVQ
jgi:hypothetical protein